MFELPKIAPNKNELISNFSPLKIQLRDEGSVLREDLKVQWQISLRTNPIWLVGLWITLIAIGLATMANLLFSFWITWVDVIWPIFITLIIFSIVYKIVKIALDESERYEIGARQGFLPAELIFSHYPLKVGENDRVTFRRRLKQNFWTNLFKINKFPVNSHIKVNLICAERASYTKGTDTVTDVAVVYENMIYSGNLLCGDREVITHFDLEIPLSYSSSFEGKNNQIRWILDIEESYPGLLEHKHTYLTFVVDP